MKNKKGLSAKIITTFILIISIFVILAFFSGKIYDTYRIIVDKKTCKTSIQAQDMVSFKNFAVGGSIKCPMQEYEIPYTNEEAIKKDFADRYYKVCDEFGQGTLNLFGKDEMTFCVIRDKISFKERGMKIKDFGKYLAEENPHGEHVSYLQYCSGFKTPRGDVFFEGKIDQIEEDDIDTNKEYLIMFIYVKGEEEVRETIKFFFGTSPAHQGMYLGGALVLIGGGVAKLTKTSKLTLPIAIMGQWVYQSGKKIMEASIIANYLTNEDILMERTSMFLIREFDENVLKRLRAHCDYLPAEQD